MATKTFKLVVFAMLSLSLMACKNKTVQKNSSVSVNDTIQQVNRAAPVPTDTIDIAAIFCPSGFMGDGEQGNKYIKYLGASKENPHSGPTCIEIQYIPGTVRWGGFYWQNRPGNWGDNPGENYTGRNYTAISFYARGKKGGEVVEFKAGGIDASGKKYKDSFEKSLGKVTLEKGWKEYKIKLAGLDLSSVIGGFCWVVAVADNPDGAIFYLDDIKYE